MNNFVLSQTTSLQVSLLSQRHIDQIMQLREKVLPTLIHEDCYIREQDEYGFIAKHCGIMGETFGIFSDKILIAYAILSYHSMLDNINLSHIAGLPSMLHNQVSQLASCMVAPAFQGLGLHKVLIKKRIALAYAKGYPHCLSIVSPQNIPSRNNLFQSGFQIHWVDTLPHLSVQHLLYYPIKQPISRLAFHLTQQVDMMDISRQQQLLQQGYYGYANGIPKQTLLFAPHVAP